MRAILGICAIAVVYFILRAEYRRNPSNFTRRFLYTAIAFFLIALAILTLTGRLNWLLALGAALIPFVLKLVSLTRYFPVLISLKNFYSRLKSGTTGQKDEAATQQGSMTRTEALQVLGLQGNPQPEEIIQAYKRLIQKIHPDKGGNHYLAAKLNEAKERLLADSH